MISKISYQFLKRTRAFSSVVKTVPGNKPPMREETTAGRYAGVLFSIGSKNQELDVLNEDMEYLNALMTQVFCDHRRVAN